MNKLSLFAALLALVFATAGCKALRRDACLKPGAYLGAKNDKPLRVPPGLDAPDTRAALKIPDPAEPAKPRATAGCLDAPPKFEAPKASRPAA